MWDKKDWMVHITTHDNDIEDISIMLQVQTSQHESVLDDQLSILT